MLRTYMRILRLKLIWKFGILNLDAENILKRFSIWILTKCETSTTKKTINSNSNWNMKSFEAWTTQFFGVKMILFCLFYSHKGSRYIFRSNTAKVLSWRILAQFTLNHSQMIQKFNKIKIEQQKTYWPGVCLYTCTSKS